MRVKILRIKEVVEMLGISKSTIWRMEKAGTFPHRTVIGKKAIGWPEQAIFKWVEGRIKNEV